MIQAGVGLSTQKNTAEAAREATRIALSQAVIDRADLALVFATADHGAAYSQLLRTVQTTAGTANVVACKRRRRAGVRQGGRADGRGCGAHRAGRRVCRRTLLYSPAARPGPGTGQEIATRVQPHRGPENLLMVFPDTYNFNSGAFFQGLSQGLSAAGGRLRPSAAGRPRTAALARPSSCVAIRSATTP